jgi:formamidopyrimidine-DNA glycosylase
VPELPEVETVRAGLERAVVGRQISSVAVLHPRAVRRHLAGGAHFAAALVGRRFLAACRRGKYLWLPLDADESVLAHLGMSGQFLVAPPESAAELHLRVRIRFSDGATELRFVDQRTFGGLALVASGEPVPPTIAHIAPDPLEDSFDDAVFTRALRRRQTGLKRALLDQTLVSGIGNIYADEALWRARLHYARATEHVTATEAGRLLAATRAVFADALRAGGTSFDGLYVTTEGEGGLFEPELAVYGRAGEPCLRCGTPVRRDRFMNRSAYFCPRCQPRPRRGRW